MQKPYARIVCDNAKSHATFRRDVECISAQRIAQVHRWSCIDVLGVQAIHEHGYVSMEMTSISENG